MGRIPARIDGGVATSECKKVTDSLIDFNARPIMIEFVIQHKREVENPISRKEKFFLMEFENSEINLNFSNNFKRSTSLGSRNSIVRMPKNRINETKKAIS